MKWVWIPWIAACALWGLNELYDAMPESRSGALAKVEAKCVREFRNANYEKASVKKTCACMVERADQWKSENPDGDYTKALHRKFAATCANRNGLARAQPPKRNGARPRPAPARDLAIENRIRQMEGRPLLKKPPPSDWGGEGGFVEDDVVETGPKVANFVDADVFGAEHFIAAEYEFVSATATG